MVRTRSLTLLLAFGTASACAARTPVGGGEDGGTGQSGSDDADETGETGESEDTSGEETDPETGVPKPDIGATPGSACEYVEEPPDADWGNIWCYAPDGSISAVDYEFTILRMQGEDLDPVADHPVAPASCVAYDDGGRTTLDFYFGPDTGNDEFQSRLRIEIRDGARAYDLLLDTAEPGAFDVNAPFELGYTRNAGGNMFIWNTLSNHAEGCIVADALPDGPGSQLNVGGWADLGDGGLELEFEISVTVN